MQQPLANAAEVGQTINQSNFLYWGRLTLPLQVMSAGLLAGKKNMGEFQCSYGQPIGCCAMLSKNAVSQHWPSAAVCSSRRTRRVKPLLQPLPHQIRKSKR